MEKMNIIDILRDCPEGTKLYSLVHGEVELTRVGVEDIYCKPDYLNHELSFNSDGRWVENQGECILFPSKENRDWTKFQRPFKDGDVVFTTLDNICIIKKYMGDSYISHCILINNARLCFDTTGINVLRYATSEEKQKLFKAIKDNGYCWDPKTKTLDPKFKVGDRIKHKDSGIYCNFGEYVESFKGYRTNIGHIIRCDDIDNWELYPLPDKFDISTLVPFESRVLMRSSNAREWTGTIFSHYSNNKFYGCGMCCDQCIPYEGNEHLLGKTIDCDGFYKNWE